MSEDIVHIYAKPDIIKISTKVNNLFKRSSFEFSITAKENAKLGQTAKLFIKFSNAETKIRNLSVNTRGGFMNFHSLMTNDGTQYIPVSIIDN